jgi:GDP-L-fucose synthase
MSKLRILLTGSGGLVGRNLLEHQSIVDYEVLAPRSSELDLRKFDQTKQYLSKHKPDLVIHAAGKVGGIQANVREPVSYLLENLDMGRNLVWATYQCGIKRLLNIGSSCMYPRNHQEPLKEEQILTGELEPTNEGYALAKIVTARLCDYLMLEDARVQFKTIIPCNIYGQYDKFDPLHSHLVPAIIHKVHQAKLLDHKVVDIWSDGMARREFMYAGDLASAIMHAIANFHALPNYLNIGLGHDHTVNEYYYTAAKVMGYSGEFIHDLSKPTGMARKLMNITRLKTLGWTPNYSLEDGIRQTYEYYLKDVKK